MNKFLVIFSHNMENNPSWRYGQGLFNTLVEVSPELAEQIRGTDKDPYYAVAASDTTKEFWIWLTTNLKDNG